MHGAVTPRPVNERVRDQETPGPGARDDAFPAREDRRWLRKGDVIVGTSAAIRRVHQAIETVCRSDIPVCVTGESGTGKELVARTTHALSPRSARPMVAVNCAAIPDGLVESELFGHARGAFTGAQASREGVFVRAHRSTLLLDEIGELKLEHQAKLLRVLQFGEVQPVGGSPRPVDVRLICATHRDLRTEVAAGRFREDLFYRLHVMPIVLPPLRERREDIPAVAGHLLRHFADKVGRRFDGFTPPALAVLESHAWPGNVREMANVIQRAMLTSPGPLIGAMEIELSGSPTQPVVATSASGEGPPVDIERPYAEQKQALMTAFERRYALEMLDATGGNISAAARRAGMDRKSLWKLLKRHGIEARG